LQAKNDKGKIFANHLRAGKILDENLISLPKFLHEKPLVIFMEITKRIGRFLWKFV
jgi:hypothetical protein